MDPTYRRFCIQSAGAQLLIPALVSSWDPSAQRAPQARTIRVERQTAFADLGGDKELVFSSRAQKCRQNSAFPGVSLPGALAKTEMQKG